MHSDRPRGQGVLVPLVSATCSGAPGVGQYLSPLLMMNAEGPGGRATMTPLASWAAAPLHIRVVDGALDYRAMGPAKKPSHGVQLYALPRIAHEYSQNSRVKKEHHLMNRQKNLDAPSPAL